MAGPARRGARPEGRPDRRPRAIVSATRTNAELFRLEDRIGTVEVGKDADLILVTGEPLDRIERLADPDCIPLVVQAGRIVKDAEGRAAV